MKKMLISLLALVTIVAVGCQRSKMHEQLILIDSLLVHNQTDSSMTRLKNIPMSEIETKADSAYYFLLLAECRYRLKGPDSTDNSTNYSIKYYRSTSDYEKLARAYYYKGVNAYNLADPKVGILLIKQAEEQAEKTDNLLLKHKIYESLSYYNGNSYEADMALLYANKALNVAKLMKDRERQAIALLYIATSYSILGNKDSLAIFVNECLSLSDYLSEKEKAYLYTRVGELYENSDPQIAKNYLLRAASVHPQPRTYLILSNLLFREDSIVKAKEVWDKALSMNKNAIVEIGILKAMRQQSVEQKDYKLANALADSIILRQQKYYEKKERERVSEIQAKYDKETAERNIRERDMNWILGSLLVVVVIIGWLGYKNYQGMRTQKNLAETRLQLEAYTKKAAELESSQKENASEISKLHRKIEDLHYRQSGILAKGKQLYEDIANGGTTVRWSKDDFINYLEYYKMKDLPFVNEMETGYNRLSPKYIFFAVLEHEKYDDKAIQHIMGISENTIRSTRSRINSKRLL